MYIYDKYLLKIYFYYVNYKNKFLGIVLLNEKNKGFLFDIESGYF